MAETGVSREPATAGIVWRKSYRAGGRRVRLAALRWLARGLGLAPLIAPLPAPPEAACRTEQAMIRRLAALGVAVPQIIEAGPCHLLLSDLGETLAAACRRENDPQRRHALIARGLDALAELHARGGWASQAFARNLTLYGERIGFIDLEEDPASVMPVPAAMARDVLFYAHSTARFLADQPGAHSALLAAHLQREAAPVRSELAKVARRLGWLAPLAWPFGQRARGTTDALRSLRGALR